MSAAETLRRAVRRLGCLSALAVCALTMPALGPAGHARAETADALRILVFGATGRAGSRIVAEALDRGHSITAVSREPSRITQTHTRLTVARGDVTDPASVSALIDGHDIVVIAVRGMTDDSKDAARTVQRVGAEVVVGALRAAGATAPRMIYVGGAGSLEVEPGVTYAESLPRIARLFMPRFVELEIEGHVLTLEYLRMVDDVEWTYISPPRDFGPGERTGRYRIGGDRMLEDDRGRSEISMEDFAVALIDEAETAEHVGRRFTVAY